MLIASIPFVRNLAEYTGHEYNYLKLTSLLHFKEDTKSIKLTDLEVIIKEILKDKHGLTFENGNNLVIDLIHETADSILSSTIEIIELENKIVLAIAIRLKAEQFMIAKINNDVFWKSIESNQTSVFNRKI